MDMLFAENQWLFFAGRAALLGIAFLCFAIAFSAWRRAGQRDMQSLSEETRELTGIVRTLAAQVGTLQARLEDRQALAAAAAPADRGYELALQLARNGAKPEEIANASGVSRQDAQLLARLHSPARH